MASMLQDPFKITIAVIAAVWLLIKRYPRLKAGFAKFGEPLEFNRLHRYKITSNFHINGEFFKAGKTFIYLNSGFSAYDGYKAFRFYDIESGLCKEIRLYDSDNSNLSNKQIKSKFKDVGTDMAEGSFTPDDGCTVSDYAKLSEHVAYFKELIEGKEPIKSWFVWLQENSNLLHENLTRADQLKFKCAGYGAVQDILKFFAISCKESFRYRYLGMHSEENPTLPLPG